MNANVSAGNGPPTIRLVEIRRVSTEEQAKDDRSGLQRQEESNRRTAARVGGTLIDPAIVVTDVCRENFIDTPEWQRIREMIVAPDVHIVCDMLDRFVGALEGLPILVELKRTNTVIYHSQGVTDPTTYVGQVMATLSALNAGNELRAIRHRSWGGREAKRREGLLASPAHTLPTGIAYIRTKGQRAGRWTYNEEISIVREVFRIVVDDGVRNWAEVARRTGDGSSARGQLVPNILTNPIYKGWWILDEKRAPGSAPIKSNGRRKHKPKVKRLPSETYKHRVFRPKGTPPTLGDERDEAIVDDATWDVVQEIVKQKTAACRKPRGHGRGGTHAAAQGFTYAGFLLCAECGRPLWCKSRHDGAHYYFCDRLQPTGLRCATKFLRREHVHVALDRYFASTLADEKFVITTLEAAVRGNAVDLSSRILEREGDVARLQGQRQKLLDLYLGSLWPRAELDRRAAKLDADLEGVERDLRRLRKAQDEHLRTKANDALRAVLLTLYEFEFWNAQQKREFLARVFPSIAVSARGVESVAVSIPGIGAPSDRETNAASLLSIKVSWDELTPSPPITDFGLPEREFYTGGDMMNLLGWSEYILRDRLKRGVIPMPEHKRRGVRAWSAVEVRKALAIVTKSRDKNSRDTECSSL